MTLIPRLYVVVSENPGGLDKPWQWGLVLMAGRNLKTTSCKVLLWYHVCKSDRLPSELEIQEADLSKAGQGDKFLTLTKVGEVRAFKHLRENLMSLTPSPDDADGEKWIEDILRKLSFENCKQPRNYFFKHMIWWKPIRKQVITFTNRMIKEGKICDGSRMMVPMCSIFSFNESYEGKGGFQESLEPLFINSNSSFENLEDETREFKDTLNSVGT